MIMTVKIVVVVLLMFYFALHCEHFSILLSHYLVSFSDSCS